LTARRGRRRNGSRLSIKRFVCAALILVACGVGPFVLGDGALGGSWISSIGIDPTAFSFLPSDSYSELRLTYRLAGEEGDPPIPYDVSFAGEALLDVNGLHRLLFLSEGSIGSWSFTSRFDLFPIAEEKSLDSKTQEPTHVYSFGGPWLWSWEDPKRLFGSYFREHHEVFIEWVKAENVYLTDPAASWYIDISTDTAAWTTVAGPFDSATHTSGEVTVNMPANYVRTRATSGFLDASYASPELVTISVADRTLQLRMAIYLAGVGLEGSMTLAETAMYAEGRLLGQTEVGGTVNASCRFNYSEPDCCVCFEDAEIQFDNWQFFCVENVDALIEFGSLGFERLELTFAMETGLPWLDIRPVVEFTTSSKTLTLRPRFLVENACITVSGTWRSGTSFAFSDLIYQIAMQYEWEDMRFTSVIVPIAESMTLGFDWRSSGSDGPAGLVFQTVFREGSSALFDWYRSILRFFFHIGANTQIATDWEIGETGFTRARFEFCLDW